MRSKELQELLNRYSNPTTNEEKIIKRQLEVIAANYNDCMLDEFLDEIVFGFCRVITLLEEKYSKDAFIYETIINDTIAQRNEYIGFKNENYTYEDANELLGDFYNHFKGPEQVEYTEIKAVKYHIEVIDNEEMKKCEKQKINLTLLDYVARIKTFAKKHLDEIYDSDMLPTSINDRIIFTYENIEYIIAKFHVKAGEKKRQNIRSALRKLNDFKRVKELNN